MKLLKSTLLIALAVVMTACASRYTLSDAERTAAYGEFIKSQPLTEVKNIRSFRLTGWRALGEEYLILNTGVKRPYLLKLKSKCFNLDYGQAIKINQSGSVLQANFDSISVLGEMQMKCYIHRIYKLNEEQKKQLIAIGRVESEPQVVSDS